MESVAIWPRSNIGDEIPSLWSDAIDLAHNLNALWADGWYTMTSIVSLYVDLRNRITQVTTGTFTESQVKWRRNTMLRTIDRKLERFETSVSRIQVLVKNFFPKASKLSTPLKTSRTS